MNCTKSYSVKKAEDILENNCDTVIICYAQFMLGAHDDLHIIE